MLHLNLTLLSLCPVHQFLLVVENPDDDLPDVFQDWLKNIGFCLHSHLLICSSSLTSLTAANRNSAASLQPVDSVSILGDTTTVNKLLFKASGQIGSSFKPKITGNLDDVKQCSFKDQYI